MRDLILARPERRLRDIMIPNVRSVPVTMDQEQVARTMQKNGYLAMPVVDVESGTAIGAISAPALPMAIRQRQKSFASHNLAALFQGAESPAP